MPFLTNKSANATPIHPVTKESYDSWRKAQTKAVQNWLAAVDFAPKAGRHEVLADESGKIASVVVGVEDLSSPWTFAGLPSKLPKGTYHIDGDLSPLEATQAAMGWLLGTYKFARYKSKAGPKPATLVTPKGADEKRARVFAAAIAYARDLINTPAEDMGPSELAASAKTLAKSHSAEVTILKGAELLKKNYPTIHAVGRASDDPPHLIDIRWGKKSDPKVTLVGKGVCFDTGGLDLKPSSGMLLMKKDMGGAATVLAMADVIMGLKLPVRLRVLVPAVENNVSGNAFRPLDVIKSRKGITIEIGNTDAEGRLVLCDAIAEACTEKPELLMDFATLTGAARVALGPDLPALFANDDALATEMLDAGIRAKDRLWQLPLHDAYRKSLDSQVADINNAGSSSFGGAITAALFLKEFVDTDVPWIHVDTMAWNTENRAGRPVGGDALGLRAVIELLETRYARGAGRGGASHGGASRSGAKAGKPARKK